MRGAISAPLAAVAAAVLILAGCSTDEPEAGATGDTGAASTPATPDSEWFVQADFDKQNEQRSATFEGDPPRYLPKLLTSSRVTPTSFG